MNRFLLAALALLCAASGGGNPTRHAITVRPDMGRLQDQLVRLVAKRWYEEHPPPYYGPESGLRGVDVWMVRRADELLSNTPVSMGELDLEEPDPAYLVSAVARAGWWKNTTQHVLVVRWRDGQYDPLLHFAGGRNWRGMDFEIVDLGLEDERYALVVEDHGCGNQCSQTRTHVFLHDRARDGFGEVFNELTTFLPGRTGLVYDSTVSFRPSDSELKDIVVHTSVEHCPSDERVATLAATFEWDGERYAGRLRLPPRVFE